MGQSRQVHGERTKRAVAWGIIVPSLVVADVLAHRFGPLIPTSPVDVEAGSYFVALSLSAAVGYSMHYHQRLSRDARRQLDDANRRIAELLVNVLPPPIAARLERAPGVIADNRGEATVLFADLAAFPP